MLLPLKTVDDGGMLRSGGGGGRKVFVPFFSQVLSLLVHKYLLTGTQVQKLTPEELFQDNSKLVPCSQIPFWGVTYADVSDVC